MRQLFLALNINDFDYGAVKACGYIPFPLLIRHSCFSGFFGTTVPCHNQSFYNTDEQRSEVILKEEIIETLEDLMRVNHVLAENAINRPKLATNE